MLKKPPLEASGLSMPCLVRHSLGNKHGNEIVLYRAKFWSYLRSFQCKCVPVIIQYNLHPIWHITNITGKIAVLSKSFSKLQLRSLCLERSQIKWKQIKRVWCALWKFFLSHFDFFCRSWMKMDKLTMFVWNILFEGSHIQIFAKNLQKWILLNIQYVL